MRAQISRGIRAASIAAAIHAVTVTPALPQDAGSGQAVTAAKALVDDAAALATMSTAPISGAGATGVSLGDLTGGSQTNSLPPPAVDNATAVGTTTAQPAASATGSVGDGASVGNTAPAGTTAPAQTATQTTNTTMQNLVLAAPAPSAPPARRVSFARLMIQINRVLNDKAALATALTQFDNSLRLRTGASTDMLNAAIVKALASTGSTITSTLIEDMQASIRQFERGGPLTGILAVAAGRGGGVLGTPGTNPDVNPQGATHGTATASTGAGGCAPGFTFIIGVGCVH